MPKYQQMSTSSSSSRKILVILALSLFIVSLILVIISSLLGGGRRISLGGGSYEQGFKDAREKAYELGLDRPIDSVYSVGGKVLEVGKDRIVIKTGFFQDKVVDGIGAERTVVIDGDTDVILQRDKDFAVYEQEELAYQRALDQVSEGVDVGIPLPISYTVEDATISDIAVGDFVMVMSSRDVDIYRTEEFVADSIKITKIEDDFVPLEIQEADDEKVNQVEVSDVGGANADDDDVADEDTSESMENVPDEQ